MAEYIFDDWKQMLSDFQASVQKSLEEIHRQKAAVQQMKADILSKLELGKYLRDEERIVISAPEIIIGNVDRSGTLLGGVGRVVVKGSSVALEGVGDTGQIASRAPIIRQTAVNPGSDGLENVVCRTSEIVSHACNIVIQSDNTIGAFSQETASAERGGIRIHADKSLQLDATLASESRVKGIDDTVGILNKQISDMEAQAKSKKSLIDKCFEDLKKLYDKEHELNDPEDFLGRVNLGDIVDVQDEIDQTMPLLYHSTIDFIYTVSQLAEAYRLKKAYEAEKKRIPTGDGYKKNTTNASMSIAAEAISMATIDGDGNMHTNPSAGISIRTPRMGISMLDDTGVLTSGSCFNVNTENVALSTLNTSKDGKAFPAVGNVSIISNNINIASKDYKVTDKGGETAEKGLAPEGKVTIAAKAIEVTTANLANQQYDDKGKLKKAEIKAEGDFTVHSKNVSILSMDFEYDNGNIKEKAQTEGSQLSVRTEKTSVLSADVQGKAKGNISLNAKAIAVKSMDVDKEKLTDKALASGSTMVMVSEKMFLGAKDKKTKSKKVQAVSEEVGLFADNTLEAQQGEKKAVLQLSGGNASVSGSKTQVYGATTINAATEVKGDLKAPKAAIDNLEAKTSFKSPNISDGIAISVPAAPANLSAILSVEEAKSEE